VECLVITRVRNQSLIVDNKGQVATRRREAARVLWAEANHSLNSEISLSSIIKIALKFGAGEDKALRWKPASARHEQGLINSKFSLMSKVL
jgi:hypothetical protein